MITVFAVFAAGYLAGSVNFPIILFRVTGRSDPRGQFSGNPGTTNVYRQAGPVWAMVVLLLDFSRAIGVAWLAAHLLSIWLIPWVGLALVLGNRYPCFHGFDGGKGVANFLGFFAMSAGMGTLYALAAWVVAYGVFRRPFIASFFLILVLGGLVAAEMGFEPPATIGIGITALFIVYNHKRNIVDLIQSYK